MRFTTVPFSFNSEHAQSRPDNNPTIIMVNAILHFEGIARTGLVNSNNSVALRTSLLNDLTDLLAYVSSKIMAFRETDK